MSIDLGQILDSVQPLVEAAIETMGTTVTIRRNPAGGQDQVTDRSTLAVTDPAGGADVHVEIPAIVIPLAGGAALPDGVNLDGVVDGYKVLLLPDVVDVQERDEIEVIASRDGRLPTRRMLVDKVPDSSAGMVRTLECEAT